MEYKIKLRYGIFVINDAKYLNDGALKLELINDNLYQFQDSEIEAIELIENGYSLNQGQYVVLPVYVKEEIKDKFKSFKW